MSIEDAAKLMRFVHEAITRPEPQVTQAEVTAWLKDEDRWRVCDDELTTMPGLASLASPPELRAVLLGALTGKAATETIQAVVERIVRLIEEERK